MGNTNLIGSIIDSSPGIYVGIVAVVGALVLLIILLINRSGGFKNINVFDIQIPAIFNWKLRFHKKEQGPKIQKVKPGQARRTAKKAANVANLGKEIQGVLSDRKKNLPAAAPDFENQQIERGFKWLDDYDQGKDVNKNALVEAKKCFDSVLQRTAKSMEAFYGLARVLEAWHDIADANKYYWEAIKADTTEGKHPRVIDAKKRFDEISKQTRQHKACLATIKNGPGKNNFWLDHIPDAKTLARYFVALSNHDEGGFILLGLDSTTRKPAGNVLDDWECIIYAVRYNYLTAPCNCEVFNSQQPRCIFIEVQTGLNRPYRVKDGDEAKVFVVGADNEVREANAVQLSELRKLKRG